jgi:hypothetical protein
MCVACILFIYGLRNETISSSDYIAPNDWMVVNNDLERGTTPAFARRDWKKPRKTRQHSLPDSWTYTWGYWETRMKDWSGNLKGISYVADLRVDRKISECTTVSWLVRLKKISHAENKNPLVSKTNYYHYLSARWRWHFLISCWKILSKTSSNAIPSYCLSNSDHRISESKY